MGRTDAAATSQRCRIQPALAVAVFVLACLVSHACGSCLSYGHSCWGAHGKRSGGAGARGSHVSRDLIDEGSDRISRGAGPQGPAVSSPPTPNSEDTLWLISKLMAAAATTQLEPGDGGGLDEVTADGAEGEDESEDDPTAVGAMIWRRLLDANEGVPPNRIPKFLRTSKLHADSISIPPDTELSGGVGIIGFASAPDGELGRGLVVLAEDPEEEEEEDEVEDRKNDFRGRDASNDEETEDEGKGRRQSRKALRRLQILNLWDNMDKRRN